MPTPLPCSHLHLHVRDLDRSQEFYARHFGMSVAFDVGHIRFLTDGRGFLLALQREESPPSMPDWFHFGFGLADNEAVRRALEALRADGVRVLDEYFVRKHGGATCCVADPDGYGIEVYHDPGWVPVPAVPATT